MVLKIGILPAAGSATRMNGIPKFLLPTRENGKSLLERHFDQMSEFVDQIWIPTKPEFVHLIASLNLGNKAIAVGVKTETMSETVLHVTNFSRGENFLLGLPDSYFSKLNPYGELISMQYNLNLAGFKMRHDQQGKLGQFDVTGNKVIDVIDKTIDCQYEYAWGAISFTQSFVNLIRPEESHVGIAFHRALKTFDVGAHLLETEYYDCGTPEEYFLMLGEVLESNE
jgi:UTP-glucose-1-phosphate uridylyltransferase